MLFAKPHSRHSNKAAFSILEIAIVVTIIGILAALALPHFKRVRDESMISTLKNDMRVLAQEFYDYELTAGEYPTTQNTAGLFPAGMEDSMPRAWILPSVVGGTYRWINSNATATDAYAYIEITGSSSYPLRISTEQLAGIDEDLDDGNLSTGRFQLHGLSIRYYLK